MINKRFEVGGKYIPALMKVNAYLTCIQRFDNGDVLLEWSDNGKHVVVTDNSFYSYIEVEND